MSAKFDDWDRDEQDALNDVREELDALRARHANDPPVDLLRAARGHALPEYLQSDADRRLAENAWSRTLVEGLDAEAASLSREDEDRLLARIEKTAALSERQPARRTWLRWPIAAAAAAAALVATTWIAWRVSDPQPAPQGTERHVAVATPPAASPFQLPLDKPDVKLSVTALTWRGARGQAENDFVADLKPAIEAYRRGDYEVAEREFSRLLTRYPTSIEILFYQGVTRLFMNDSKGAIERLAQAEAVADQTFAADVAWYRAVADLRAGNAAAAGERLARLCATSSERADASCAALKKLEASSRAPR